jgi:hypothetical protein
VQSIIVAQCTCTIIVNHVLPSSWTVQRQSLSLHRQVDDELMASTAVSPVGSLVSKEKYEKR